MTREPRLIRRRARYERNFTQIANSWLRDDKLSYRARGVLSAVWSHDDGWSITLQNLASESPREGIDAIRTAVEELEAVGYLRRIPIRGVGSQFLGHDWEISDPHDLGDVPLFGAALDDPTRPVDNRDAASDDPTRTASDDPTPIRTPVKTLSKTSQGDHRAKSEAQSARPSGADFVIATSARAAADSLRAVTCPNRRGKPHVFEASGYCRTCGTRRPDEGDGSPLVVNTTTGEVA
ncbi:hypothetical protein [Agromyces sp. S2-1-8]|uniref:hypothetical protein n=1 Tax=Agromyces sp. S2-1-8 TaxID=2897180 RepID=UPI001E433228|nr:hypothetical protein [Agromyces sp. S2-1-8]MCD5345064.1 hypothetical protein [Agromyces sp. S2-1-8]